MNFSLRLKELREEIGFSQAQLARALNVGVGSVGMWESTDRIPPAKKLSKIADYFHVSTDYLLGREELGGITVRSSESSLPENERQLLALFRSMTRPQQVRFVAYGEGIVGAQAPAVKV